MEYGDGQAGPCMGGAWHGAWPGAWHGAWGGAWHGAWVDVDDVVGGDINV